MTDWLVDHKLPDATTERGAFLFLIGIILNQNISGELAWLGVKRLSRRVDTHPRALALRQTDELEAILRHPPAIHPFAATMARAIAEAAVLVRDHYHYDTRRLWREASGVDETIARLARFRQVGRHKADVAVFLLTEVYHELHADRPIYIEDRCPALLTYLS